MADPPRYPTTDDNTAVGSGRPAGGTPRWKRVLLVAAVIALLAVFLVLHVTGVLGPESHK